MGQSYPPGYLVTKRADAPGNDIKKLTNVKMDDCAKECNNDDKCKAFNYSSGGLTGDCWLKNGFENITESNGLDFLIKEHIKTTKPDPLSCPIPDSKPTDTELQKLTACKDAMSCYSKIVNYNEQISSFNDSQKALLKASIAAWRIREKRARDDQKSWDKRKEEIFNSNQESKEWNNCVATWDADAGRHDDWCRNDFGEGWYHSGKSGYRCGLMNKGICSKTDDKRVREAIAQVKREWGDRPSDFAEREPKQENFPLADQNQTSINLNCCSNYMNVTGNAKQNIQSCQQEIQQRIDNPQILSPSPSNNSTPATVPKRPEESTSAIPLESQIEEESSNTKIYILIAILLLILIILLIILLY